MEEVVVHNIMTEVVEVDHVVEEVPEVGEAVEVPVGSGIQGSTTKRTGTRSI